MIEGFKHFGFNAINLALPKKWDLTSFLGNRFHGGLTFDDGEKETMRVEWGRLGGASEETIEKKCFADFKKQGEFISRRYLKTGELFIQAQSGGKPIVFLLKRQREWDRYLLFKFYQPDSDTAYELEKIITPLERCMPDTAQHWEFFATDFRLEPGWVLTRGRMNIGCIQLDFEREGRILTLWDMSMLERTLKKNPRGLLESACILVERAYPKRLALSKDGIHEDAIAAGNGFTMKGEWRWRWMLFNPFRWLFGNRLIWMQCIMNRKRNRFSYVLLLCRKEEEFRWLGQLPGSLMG